MSLNDIKLSAHLIAALYPECLVTEDAEVMDVNKQPAFSVSDEPAVQAAYKSLGNNKKQVLVAVNYADVMHLPDAMLEFLTRLLNSCNLSLADVAIVNLNNYPNAAYRELVAHFRTKIILLFGISPAAFGLPFEIPEFQVQQFPGVTTIYSPALHDIEHDKLSKGKLWTGLKKIFKIG